MLLGYLILLLAAIAVWHFIVDGILAPSAQLLTQARLIVTHREIEQAARSKDKQLDPKVCHLLMDSSANLAKHIGAYNIVTLYRMNRKFRRDPSFQRQVAHQVEVLEGAKLPQITEFKRRLQETANVALCWNSIGWLLYVPVLLVAFGMYEWTSRMVKALIALPEYQWAKLDGAGTATMFGRRYG